MGRLPCALNPFARPHASSSNGCCSDPSATFSLKPRDNFIQVANEFLPAVIRTPVVRFLVRTETGLLHADQRAIFRRRQRPGDDGLLSHKSPRVVQSPVRFDANDLTLESP